MPPPPFPSPASKPASPPDPADSPRSPHALATPALSAAASPLASLTRAELEARVLSAEAGAARYACAARALLAALALSPLANAHYSGVARALLRASLAALPTVASVDVCECSFPAVASGAEAPALASVRWDGLGYSEWDADWRPASWWLGVQLTTALGLVVRVRVSGMRVRGRVRVALAGDLSAVRVAFAGRPVVELSIETAVSMAGGYVPVPIRETIDEGIRKAVSGFVRDNLVKGQSMIFVLRRRPVDVSDEDIATALEAAQRQSSIAGLI